MKRDDLFTKLHDQYNTFPSSIQDPEAFHHDVFEISHQATSSDEFHEMMADRKQHRLRELNDSLESAALEIIANPSLIGTVQWQYALQLFRTKSLDSLVRYFASYLPDDHPWHRIDDDSTTSESASEGIESLTNSTTFYIDPEDKPILTDEPLAISASIEAQLPPSPRSFTMLSDASVPSDDGRRNRAYVLNMPTPARTLSFSGSEAEPFDKSLAASRSLEDDDTSQPSDPESPITSVSDVSESGFVHVEEDGAFCLMQDEVIHTAHICSKISSCGGDYSATEAAVAATFDLTEESATPTPKPEQMMASSYLDLHRKASPSTGSIRTRSPSRPHLHNSTCLPHCSHHDTRNSSPKMRHRREGSPMQNIRRSPGEPLSRIQKPLPDPIRCRPKGRRRYDATMA